MSKEQLDLLDWLVGQPSCSSEVMPTLEDAPAEVDVTSVRLTRSDPACNMPRFYSLELATSLFGEHGVVRHWGGSEPQVAAVQIGARNSVRRRAPFESCSG